jgi:predicted  nucleic acid-binding Zn-ribbon protein
MSHTLSLFRLQQIDTQLDRAQTRLNKIQDILGDDKELQIFSERVNASRTICQSADQDLKKTELETRNQRIKIEQTEASLYTGKGHSPKELLDLQNDIASLKRYLVVLEDSELDAMQTAEEALSSFQVAQTLFQSAQNHSVEQNRGLQEEQATLLKELDKLKAERAAVAGSIPNVALILYDTLRRERSGLAVAVISEKSCSACGSGLSAAQMQSSRASGEMALCPSCGRILYGS